MAPRYFAMTNLGCAGPTYQKVQATTASTTAPCNSQHKQLNMQISNLLALCALPFLSLAAKSPNTSAFEKYSSLQGSSPTIDLDATGYDELTGGQRDYSVAVLLTAIDKKYQCKLCREFQPEWEMIGRSWQKGDKKKETRTLFATIDFDREKTIFQRVRIYCQVQFGTRRLLLMI